jgi:hypothetical protein
VDKTLFTLKHGNDFLLVQIYVDDIIFGGYSHVLVSSFTELMENESQMSMMGELTFFLGIQIKQTKQGTFVHQAKYTKDLMKKFNMAELKPMSTRMSMTTVLDLDENGEAINQREYKSMIGSLVCLCACFQASPRISHRQVIQWIFRYFKYTLEFGISYYTSSSLDLVGFSDADFVGCGIDQKITFGTCHFLLSSLVCWSSRKQTSVAQSTIDAEDVAAASCCTQIIWIMHTMRDYGVSYKSVALMCDSSSAICLAQSPVFHGRVKYIKVRHHFLRDHERREI